MSVCPSVRMSQHDTLVEKRQFKIRRSEFHDLCYVSSGVSLDTQHKSP
jgi:hypothetical protein